MSPTEVKLSQVPADPFWEEMESEEATAEILRISGFGAVLREAEDEIGRGELTPVEHLQRKRVEE